MGGNDDSQQESIGTLSSILLIIPTPDLNNLFPNQNYFAETEQVAFCTGNIVPGMDYSNDPMLGALNSSY